MPSNTNYALYWSPSGAGAYPTGFIAGVNTYFTDLEHDNAGHQNVDSVAAQYNDAAGEFAEYKSKFGGELLDEQPYPSNGCHRALKCLTDQQIKEELVRFIAAEHLPTGLTHEYFVLTPEGVESCFEAAGLQCSANAESHAVYCAYHGNLGLVGGGEIIYANDPFVNGKRCDETEHHINGPSDSALFGGLSHEHNESLTDPEPNNAWTDFGGSGELTGYEDGDKCRTFTPSSEFGAPLGEVEVEGKKLTYNQEVNGHKYWYQQEWSNKGDTCLQRLTFEASEAPTATFTSAEVTANEVKFDATGSTTGTNVRYSWQFNDAGGAEPRTIETEALTLNHTFPSAGTYTVALTVFKTDGTSRGIAKQVLAGKKAQSIAFESSPPGSAVVGGPTYSVSANASSGLAVALTIDASSSSVCTMSGSVVHFVGSGTCTIDADQAGNAEWESAPRAQQSFAVAGRSQTVAFTSTAPSSAVVGGPTYVAAATATSGLLVSLSSATPAVCSLSGASVSFVGAGTCTIDADQAGDAEYSAAPQAQQSFAVGGPAPSAPPILQPSLIATIPDSSFSALRAAVNPADGAITFTESVPEPGTFSWLIMFQNGKFGAFSSSSPKCKPGFIRLSGKCRPGKIVFARGVKTVTAAGTVSLTITPSTSALKALKNALKQRKGLPITSTLTFQSSLGGSPASRTQSLTVKLKKK
jgi:PKD repeat protein